MRTIADHLDNIRDKPHHVRRRVAFGAAGAITGVIALLWLGLSLSTGTFALKDSNFAELTGAEPTDTTSADTEDTSALAGAAAAGREDDTTPHIEVVPPGNGVEKTSSGGSSNTQTIIPF